MGRNDNRKSMKMRRRKGWRKKKERLQKRIATAKKESRKRK